MDRSSSIHRPIRTYDPANVPATARSERFAYTDVREREWVIKSPAFQAPDIAKAQARHRRPSRKAASGS